MALKHSMLLAAAFALAPAISIAQEGTAKPTGQDKPAAVPAPATATTTAPVEVTVPVVGLTNENSAKAKEALEGLTTKAYVCAPCHETQGKAGNCSHCKAPLAAKELKPIGNVMPAADKGTVAFKVSNARVSLSQIETALQKNSLKIDREKLQFRGPVVIAVNGAKDPAAVEQALKDSKLFSTVEANLCEDTNQVHVWVQPGSSAATLATITAALEKQPQGWKVSDVIWGASSEKAS
jgi:hypothetical protein